jgi:hypothetical protein
MMTDIEVRVAYNMLWVVSGVVVAVYMAHRLYRGKLSEDAKPLALGVMAVAIFGALMRAWFAAMNYAEAWGMDEEYQFLFTHREAVAPLVFGVCVGYGYHLRPLLYRFLGRWWMIGWLVGVVGVFYLAAVFT